MGHILTAHLEQLPQAEGAVSSNVISPANDLQREVLRCPQCSLVQFRTQNSLCRRCHGGLDVPVAAASAGVPETDLEPGIETAEATGDGVPDVASAIRTWRQRRGLSQRELAARMHVPRTYVSKIENDKATPTLTSLHRMATAMDTNIATLLECAGAGAPDAPHAYEVEDLLRDAFIRDLIGFLPHLVPRHQDLLVGELRQRTLRLKN